jgi:hypothetical protein
LKTFSFKNSISFYSSWFLPFGGEEGSKFIYLWLIRILWSNMNPNKISRATCTWAQYLTESEDVGFSSSQTLYMLELIIWLGPRMLGLAMGLEFGCSQGCWVWQFTRLVYVWAQHLAMFKDARFDNLLDLYMLRLNAWLNPIILGLIAHQTYICLGSELGWA